LVPGFTRADVVTDWNTTLNDVIIATPQLHNPGNPTRAMAMLNGAIYDIFQAVNRTHVPFKVNTLAPGADINAAVATAAHKVLQYTYGVGATQQDMIDDARDAQLGPGPYNAAQLAGIALGNTIGDFYVAVHATDDMTDALFPSPDNPLPGQWSTDPRHPGQKGWGSNFNLVHPWVMGNPDDFDSYFPGPPALDSPEYVAAFNMVKDYGQRVSPSRTDEQTEIGLFWAYDRPSGVGPPPVLFMENMIEISEQVGNSPRDNARMFAMAAAAQADAAIAAWDVKYEHEFWRPVTAIRADSAHDDDNPNTAEDAGWTYLGSPGGDPNSADDDFTPPFPAYTSGHATMGGAVYKAIELFYGTNNFALADQAYPGDLATSDYELTSNEFGIDGIAGITRSFDKFTQVTPLLAPGDEDSPEGENTMSRIYLGVHWIFDQTHGVALGNAVAEYAASHYFQAVPEPSAVLLIAGAVIGCLSGRRRPRIIL
jgi:hypothetical protein